MASTAKIGRGKRSPSNKMYTSAKRWELNKKKCIQKEAKKQEVPKTMKVARGTMRIFKRVLKQRTINVEETGSVVQQVV